MGQCNLLSDKCIERTVTFKASNKQTKAKSAKWISTFILPFEQTLNFLRTIAKSFWAEVENTFKMPPIVKQKTDKSSGKIEGRGIGNIVGELLSSQNLFIVA